MLFASFGSPFIGVPVDRVELDIEFGTHVDHDKYSPNIPFA